MNHTDSVPTGEREADAFDRATEAAEWAIYEKLKDLFGVQGENLCFCLEHHVPPTPLAAVQLLGALRGEYRKRVASDANRMIEESHD